MERSRIHRLSSFRLVLVGLLSALLFTAGCKDEPGAHSAPNGEDPQENGEDPTENGPGLCTEDQDCPLGQVCIGGVCEEYLHTDKEWAGCIADTDCGPTERCATWSGLCVDVADSHPPSTREGDVCLDGEKRTCGVSKVGACRLGSETCIDGQWSGVCVGNRDPAPEVCDGRDNDCDGVVDNSAPADASCDDHDPCTGSPRCERGRCVPGTPVSCAEHDSACTVGVCDSSDGSCSPENLADGLTCDDGDRCSVGSTCDDGSCVGGTPVSCAHLDTECMVGQCDPDTGGCRAVPRTDGTTCDDGNLCTLATTCQEGVCGGGAPVDCSGEDDQCLRGVCDGETGLCTTVPRREGQSCDDGQYCTVSTTCQEGVCTGGLPRNCTTTGDQCNAGVCDPTAGESGACVKEPYGDGRSCQDGRFCTVDTTCQADGSCGGGQPRNCSGEGGSCRTGICDEEAGECTGEPVADGTECDDGLFCTVNNQCAAGECVGVARDCSEEDDQCNVGVCDETAGVCTPEPANDGETCDDGRFCTVETTCSAGECVGAPRDCDEAADQCNTGICDDFVGACVPEPVANNTVCNDGLWCTVNNRCLDGTCTGQPRDCSGVGDQCNEGICNEEIDACETQTVADGTSCDDDLFCTVNDQCQSGDCVGSPRNCSHVADQCNTGVCDEDAGACVQAAVADGTDCDDGYWCTIDDACFSGVCDGLSRDCSGPYGDDPCWETWCNEDDNQCRAQNVCDPCLEGTPTADAGDDQEVVPDTVVSLDGTGSTDPNGQALSYSWEVVSRPDGSVASLSNPSSPTPTLLGDVSGQFEVCLTVTNPDGCVSEPDCMRIVVKPQVQLHIELVWFSDGTDFDLHYRAPFGTWFTMNKGNCSASDQATVTWFCVMNPDWGYDGRGLPDGDPTNNPSLDVDNFAGFGPENINQERLFDGKDGEPFRIGVHYWADRGHGPKEARVRVYVDGELAFEERHTFGCREFWDVADLYVTGNGTSVEIVSLNKNVWEPGRGFCG
jgi:hypothetical protein